MKRKNSKYMKANLEDTQSNNRSAWAPPVKWKHRTDGESQSMKADLLFTPYLFAILQE